MKDEDIKTWLMELKAPNEIPESFGNLSIFDLKRYKIAVEIIEYLLNELKKSKTNS